MLEQGKMITVTVIIIINAGFSQTSKSIIENSKILKFSGRALEFNDILRKVGTKHGRGFLTR